MLNGQEVGTGEMWYELLLFSAEWQQTRDTPTLADDWEQVELAPNIVMFRGELPGFQFASTENLFFKLDVFYS